MGVAFSFIALLTTLSVADVLTRLPVTNPPESIQARPLWKDQPAPPWSKQPNLEPKRQPHYQAMYAAYCQLGAEEVNRMIDDAAACVGVGRFRTVEQIGETKPVTLTIGGGTKLD